MTYIFAPVIQNDRLSGEPVTLLLSSGGKECTRLRRSRVNFWASRGFQENFLGGGSFAGLLFQFKVLH